MKRGEGELGSHTQFIKMCIYTDGHQLNSKDLEMAKMFYGRVLVK